MSRYFRGPAEIFKIKILDKMKKCVRMSLVKGDLYGKK